MQIGLQADTFNILNELLKQFAQFTPNVLGALVIILLGFIIVKVLSRIVRKTLEKVGMDKLADNTINKIDVLATNNIVVKPSKLAAQIVYYSGLLIVLVAATDVLKMDAVSNLVKEAVNYVPSLITAMMLLAIGLIIADFVQDVALAALQSLNVPASKFVSGFIFYFILINVLMLALEQAKINTDFITANLSIILAGIVLAFSIGYGLASKAIMSNHIAYFYNRKKINIGDSLKLNDKKGVVERMDSTSLTLLAEDNQSKIIIPLSLLDTEAIEVIPYKEEHS